MLQSCLELRSLLLDYCLDHLTIVFLLSSKTDLVFYGLWPVPSPAWSTMVEGMCSVDWGSGTSSLEGRVLLQWGQGSGRAGRALWQGWVAGGRDDYVVVLHNSSSISFGPLATLIAHPCSKPFPLPSTIPLRTLLKFSITVQKQRVLLWRVSKATGLSIKIYSLHIQRILKLVKTRLSAISSILEACCWELFSENCW